jgi:hypothetical protein
MRANFLLAITLMVTTGCRLNKADRSTGISGTWRIQHIETLYQQPTADAFANEAMMNKAVQDGILINFFEDGSYTTLMGSGSFEMGLWKFSSKDSLLELMPAGLPKRTAIASMHAGNNSRETLMISDKQENRKFIFNKESESLKQYKDDPFYTANNTWRMKPDTSETDAALNNRLAGYFKHLALVLRAAKERKQSVVSFEFSQGPAKIYSGGIGILPFDVIPVTWKNTFYNETDAAKAWNYYSSYLERSHYRGASTGEWIEDDYTILLSIYADLHQTPSKPSSAKN